MQTEQVLSSRLLPKTGQVYAGSSYDGDDGFHEAGWWKGLKYPNNKTRFIAKTISGADVVIDMATGLMWAKNFDELGCDEGGSNNWLDAIIWANGLIWGGFEDWRLPNINEMMSICDYGRDGVCIHSIFTVPSSGAYWSSTTYAADTSIAFKIYHPGIGHTKIDPKSSDNLQRAVRLGV